MNERFVHIIYFGSAVAFVVVPFQRSRSRAAWARRIFFTIAGLFMVLAVSGISLDFELWNPSRRLRFDLPRYFEGLRGFLLGCFFVLLVSGELLGKKILRDEVAA
jgi:hypothetical protein